MEIPIYLLNAYTQEVKTPSCDKVCAKCPFRKDRPPWQEDYALIINKERIKKNSRQHCHMLSGKGIHKGCKGFDECVQGGNDIIFSIEEFNSLQPVSQEDALINYKHEENINEL